MAAGLGFKTFLTGDVLTAADTNGYLMQGVLVFATAAARDSAITSPQEGQTCYLKDTDAVMTYSGSAWVAVGGTSGPTFSAYASATQSMTAVTFTKQAMNTELWDSDNCYNTTTYRFTPTKAGYYQVNVNANFNGTPGRTLADVYKNGTAYLRVCDSNVASAADGAAGGSVLVDLNGSTDYIEFFALTVNASTRLAGSTENRFSAMWLRSL